MNRKGLAVGLILLFVGTSAIPLTAQNIGKPSLPTSRGNWLYVGGDGPGNYTRIQDAINDSSDGDTVFVYNDHSPYNENIVVSVSISLIGEDKSSTIVDGTDKDDVFRLLKDKIEINGFTIRNGNQPSTRLSGIDIQSCNNSITNNIILNNHIGIWLSQANNHYNVISNNIIKGSAEEGIWLYASHNNIISNNTIIENTGAGLLLYGSSNCNLVADNNISKNGEEGIYSNGCNNNTIIRNTFTSNTKNGFCGLSLIDYNFSNNYFRDNVGGLEIDYSIKRGMIRNNVFINDGYLGLVHNNIFYNNTVNGRPMLFLSNEHDRVIEGDVGQVLIDNCSNLTLQNLVISHTASAILLDGSENCRVKNNILTFNDVGIYISLSCKNNAILNNKFSQNSNGITIYSFNNLISENNITFNDNGIFQENYGGNNNISYNYFSNNKKAICMNNAYNCTFKNNIITSNDEGIVLSEIYDFLIIGNEISDNKKGIYISNLFKDTSSRIINNNFFRNLRHVKFLSTLPLFKPSKWDSNYWDNYHGSGPKLFVGLFAYYVWIYYQYNTILVIPWIEADWHPAQVPYNI